ncbi:hypothetical protein ACR3K2_25350 [Cryptosporidium serpentis]
MKSTQDTILLEPNELDDIKNVPNSIKSIENLVSEMGINSYDPQIIPLLADIAFAITEDLVLRSNENARINSRNLIEEVDARMAIMEYMESNIMVQHSDSAMRSLSTEINSLPLPSIPNKGVLRAWFPNEAIMTTSPNWHPDIESIETSLKYNSNN